MKFQAALAFGLLALSTPLYAISIADVLSGKGSTAAAESCVQLVIAQIEKHTDEWEWLRDTAENFKDSLRLPDAEAIIKAMPVGGAEQLSPDDLLFEFLRKHQHIKLEMTKNRLRKEFTALAKRLGRMPNLKELAEWVGISEAELQRSFGIKRLYLDRDELKKAAISWSSKSFESIIDTDIFDGARLEKMITALKTRKRIVVTSAVAGAPVDLVFFNSLLKYCDENDAEIFVYPQNMQTFGLDEVLLSTPRVHVITHHIEASPWLRLNRIKLIAKQRDPLTGLDVLGPRIQSQIVGHPQARMRTVPTMDNQLFPKKLASTGALTLPNYGGGKYIQGRTNELAETDHFMGAIVLERSGGADFITGELLAGNFHMRHIEFFPETGGFTDLGTFYTPDSSRVSRPEALVLGDIHVGCTDQKLLATLRQQIFTMKPKYVVLHDVLNGHSVSAHDANKLMTLSMKQKNGELSLKTETKNVVSFINAVLDVDPQIKVIIVPSNHDFWLTRWLEEGRFMSDNENRTLGLELAKELTEGKDPLEYALGKFGLANDRRVIFLKTGEQFKTNTLHRVDLGLHGDAGANGGKASLASLRKACDRAVFGHSHTTGRANAVVNVGTSTYRVLGYTKKGVSSWVQTLALVDDSGGIQLLEFQDNQWFNPGNETAKDPNEFFMPGYPRALRNSDTGSAGTLDQYGGN